MKCETCSFWVTHKYNHYSDGSTIDTYKAPDGKGLCDKLSLETAADFGCNKYFEGNDHTQIAEKQGAPWQHPNWKYGPCPNCSGVGCHMVEMRPACRHCAGLGRVRYYDDGYIADASWDHPKEKELKRLQRKAADDEALREQAARLGFDISRKPDPGLTLAPAKKDERNSPALEGGGNI